MKRLRLSSLTFLVCAFFLAACSASVPTPTRVTVSIPATPTLAPTPSPAPTDEPTREPSPTAPAKIPEGGAITLGLIGQPSFQVTTLPRFLSAALYDSLLQFDPRDGSPRAGLAETWTVSSDARTFDFHLRANVTWHDGQALTADDVVFTLATLSNPKTRVTPLTDFGPLDQITTVNAQTVRVTFKSPDCAALANLGAVKILPKHILDKANLAQLTPPQLIGSGPLKLVEYQSGDAFVLTRNENYWQGAPHIQDWTLKIFPNASAQADAFAKGTTEVIEYDIARGIEPGEANGARIYSYPSNSFYGLAISNTVPALNDVRVRQALSAAIDRNALVQDVVDGRAQAMDSSLLPTFWGYASPALGKTDSAQLFSDAGWTRGNDGIWTKNGKPLVLMLLAIADDPIAEPLAYRVRAMLGAAGVNAQLRLGERNFYLTRLFDYTFDLALVQWNLTLDPDQTFLWNSKQANPGNGFNIVSYANPRVDDWFAQALAVPSCDQNARQKIYAQAYKQIAQDASYVFLFTPERGLVARTRVGGLAPSSFAGDYWNLRDWFVGGN